MTIESTVNRRIDALGVFYTGGSSNTDPDACLGGAVSSTRVRGLGGKLATPIPGIRIDNIFPANGEGEAAIRVVTEDSSLVYLPPGGSEGTPVPIAAGESKIIAGVDQDKAIRVYRESGLGLVGRSVLTLVNALNGVMSMNNITDAQRQAGVTAYRCLMLQAQGDFGVLDTKLWMPPVASSQAVFSLATETPVAGSVQSIADQFTAPGGVSWSTPTAEGSALEIPTIDVGEYVGVWIRKVFPAAGTRDPQEDFQLTMNYWGA